MTLEQALAYSIDIALTAAYKSADPPRTFRTVLDKCLEALVNAAA